jgi:hypothetical protein
MSVDWTESWPIHITGCFSAHLLDDEKEIHKGGREGRDVRDYGNDFAPQVIQELLQLHLVSGHADGESVDSVFHSQSLLLYDPYR